MSVLSRVTAPAATHDLAGAVVALLSSPTRSAPRDLPGSVGAALPKDESQAAASVAGRLATAPRGLGTSAARAPWGHISVRRTVPVDGGAGDGGPALPMLFHRPAGLGTSAGRVPAAPPIPAVPVPAAPSASTVPVPAAPAAEATDATDGAGEAGPELYCPPAVRDDVALGEAVNERLVEWAEQVGIYPEQLDKVRAANFGRLIMLTHPASDDPDRLLAAAKCILAEWATDDHLLDDESLGADANLIGSRLGIAYASIDPADLPVAYAPQLDQALLDEPVSAAYRSAFEHLGRYATATQVARLRHELAVMFMAYNHEANWRREGRVPPVWEYLTHRHENSFLPPMVLVDPVAGYELPAFEFADRRVRRVFCLAGTASVVLNDVYSKARETDEDFDLPKVIAIEEGCSPEEAMARTVEIHNELMHTFEAEATALSILGSPALRRFLADIWAWLGGNREWHSTSLRYHSPGT